MQADATEGNGQGDGGFVGGVVADEDGGSALEGRLAHEPGKGCVFGGALWAEFVGHVGGQQNGAGAFGDQGFGQNFDARGLVRGLAVMDDEADGFLFDQQARHGLGGLGESLQPVIVGFRALGDVVELALGVAQDGAVLGGGGEVAGEEFVDFVQRPAGDEGDSAVQAGAQPVEGLAQWFGDGDEVGLFGDVEEGAVDVEEQGGVGLDGGWHRQEVVGRAAAVKAFLLF